MDKAFFDRAENVLRKLLTAKRPGLMAAYGRVESELKTDNTIVTELDRQLEIDIREALTGLDAGIPIVGEELGGDINQSTYWLVDPIDGTEQFTRGLPGAKNLVCLIENGQPVWALMYMFVRDEWYIARKGGGTYLNGQKVTRKYRPLNRCWVELSVNFLDDSIRSKVVELRPQVAGFTMFRDTSYLVQGGIDAWIRWGTGGGPWDYAPRALLLQEAGAKIGNIGQDSYDFTRNDFLVADPANFDQLMDLLT